MVVVDTYIKMNINSRIASAISWKTFRSDKDFLEVLEDILFWKMMIEADKKEFVKEEDVLERFKHRKDIYKVFP